MLTQNLCILTFRFGYCDDSSALPVISDPVAHKYFEVETTLLPNEMCKLQSRT